MTFLTIDFETYYDPQFSLSKMTTEEYIRDSRFEVIGVGVKQDAGQTEWFSGTKAETKRFLSRYDWANAVALAHNAPFDMAILGWVFGIHPKKIADTLSMGRATDGPDAGNSLKAMGERYGVGVKGDEVIHALGKRRLDFTTEELNRYGSYCCNDVDMTYDLFNELMRRGFPASELAVIDATVKMFSRPLLWLDRDLLETHLTEVKAKKEALINKALVDKDDLMSNAKFAKLLEDLGVEPPMKVSPTTGKDTYAFAKSDEALKALLNHENPLVQAIVAARLGVKSTLEETRTERFIDISKRGPLPVPLRYYAAHTGRWGGDDKVNLQNLPRKSMLKKAIQAPEGYVFIDCDSSQIEARTLAWLAGQNDLVDAFAKGEDVYKIMASAIYGVPVEEVDDEQRFVGKTTILGCFGPDTKVLTSNGWKRIVEVQATDTLWDGEEWVSHEGVVPQGEKEVLTAWGLTATLDHEILTEHGWQEWSEVATSRSLFQSAIDRASWKSCDGSNITNPLGALRGGIPWSGVPVGGKAEWTDKTSRLAELLGVMSAPKAQPLLLERSIGATKASFLTSRIANAYSIVSQVVSDVATTLVRRPTPITGVGVSLSMPHGGLIGALSYGTSSHSMGGKTLTAPSTGWTITEGMNRIISALSRAAKTPATNGRRVKCRQRLMTYDIAYAGPRNRYTVATDAGPIIVHNCGYGMGAKKFQAQLKTFNVTLPLEECERIISVYRETYPMIPRLWRAVGDALEAMANQQYTDVGYGVSLRFDGIDGVLLPNGLRLRYPGLRFKLNEDKKMEMVYDTKKGKAVIPTRIYGGKAVENVCQALARIVVSDQLVQISRRLPVVMTVHDAVGSLAPKEKATEARAYVEACMRKAPAWAAGLPLNCESKMGETYGG